MGATSALSAFMNNTTVTAMLLPAVSGVARRAKVSPSKLLMPLAYASMLGGTCTLIGTSTNVAVSGYIAHHGLAPLGLFEITPIGLIICAIGIAYMVFIGQRRLPDHREESLTADYVIREYLCEVIVLPHSPLIGQKSVEWDLSPHDLRILKLLRGEEELPPASAVRLQSGDTPLVEGKVENLVKIKTIEGLEIKLDSPPDDRKLQSGAFRLAEVLVTPQSHLAGWTLRRAGFQQRFGVTVIAIYRHGQALRERLAEVSLRVGDLLLVRGPEGRVQALRGDPDLAVIGEHRPPVNRERQGLYTVVVFAAALIGGGFGWLPLSIATMLAASVSFIAPFEPSCILVYGPGKYRFHDYLKTGLGLTLLLSVVVLLLIPHFWPLR